MWAKLKRAAQRTLGLRVIAGVRGDASLFDVRGTEFSPGDIVTGHGVKSLLGDSDGGTEPVGRRCGRCRAVVDDLAAAVPQSEDPRNTSEQYRGDSDDEDSVAQHDGLLGPRRPRGTGTPTAYPPGLWVVRTGRSGCPGPAPMSAAGPRSAAVPPVPD